MAFGLTIYLSIPHRLKKEAERLKEVLESYGYYVYDPCTVIPSGPPEEYPDSISKQCYQLLDNSDLIVFYADTYGRDCAAEVGYAINAEKPVFPLSVAGKMSELLDQDWMIRPRIMPLSKSLDELHKRISSTFNKKYEKKYPEESVFVVDF